MGKILLISMVTASILFTGCRGTETNETDSNQETTTEKVTEVTVVTKVTYESKDNSYSIILPDSSWQNTKQEENETVFVSAKQGEIAITHETGEAVGDLLIRKKENNLLKALKNIGVNTDLVEIKDFQYDNTDSIKTASYMVAYNDTTSGDFYILVSVKASASEGYQVYATVKSADEKTLKSMKETVDSFQLTKELAKESVETDSEMASAEAERYFFDEEGNTVYTSPNAEGAWVDSKGMVYYFYETEVEDKNGVKYYYDPPAYRTNSSDSNSSDTVGVYYDFYDVNGNYIKATQDENGKWVGSDGKTYIFGTDGVTDSDGNFHPY